MKKIVKEIISTIIIIGLLAPVIIYIAPFLIGGSFSSIVMSGSMEPAIPIGSIVVIKKINLENIEVGDIIAFKTGETTTLHRVIDKIPIDSSFYFKTKGDANEDPDPWTVKPEDIKGALLLTIPYYGYLIWFAGTPLGVMIFLIAPAIIIIADEIRKIILVRRKADK